MLSWIPCDFPMPLNFVGIIFGAGFTMLMSIKEKLKSFLKEKMPLKNVGCNRIFILNSRTMAT